MTGNLWSCEESQLVVQGSWQQIFCELNLILLMCQTAPLMPLTIHYVDVHHCSITKKEKGSLPVCPALISIVSS